MPNITTRIGQHCISHGYIHNEEYLECDFCSVHKSFINLKYRYYNYGFSKRSYLACDECHEYLFGPFRLVDGGIKEKAYESIIEVIKERTSKEVINYYEAVRIAYNKCKYMQNHFNNPKTFAQINKDNKALWEFTYRILNEEKERVKVVNKDPDNLLVSWIPEGNDFD